ncbi:MAG: condensation domain-containing protein, partial [Blastocatellia bacterium]
MPIVLNDVADFYAASDPSDRIGHETIHQESALEFSSYVDWLQRQDQSGCADFWKRELSGLNQDSSFASERAGHATSNPSATADAEPGSASTEVPPQYADEQIRLTLEETAGIQALARRQHMTVSTLLDAAWALLLSHYRGSEDVTFGVTVSGRPAQLPGSDSTVGLFINTLPLRICAARNESVIRWMASVRERTSRILEYEHSSLADILRWSGAAPGSELFDTVLVFENYPVDSSRLERWGELTVKSIRSIEETNYPVTLQITPAARLAIRLSYRMPDLDAVSVKRILEQLRVVLTQFTGGNSPKLIAEQVVGEIGVLTDAEIHNVIYEWNKHGTRHPVDCSLHATFVQQAKLQPDSMAIVCDGAALTYRAVDIRSANLANGLRRLGAGPEALIGICAERSAEMIVGIVGILKTGAAYVPLDPVYPNERLEFIASHSAMKILVTEDSLKGRVP